jgi:hypothetical protein
MSRAGCPRIVPDPTISTDGYRELAVFQLIHHSRGGAARRVPWPHVFRCRPIIWSLSVEVIVVTSPGGARSGRVRRLASGLPAHDEILRVSPASPVGGTYLYAEELRCSVARSRGWQLHGQAGNPALGSPGVIQVRPARTQPPKGPVSALLRWDWDRRLVWRASARPPRHQNAFIGVVPQLLTGLFLQ